MSDIVEASEDEISKESIIASAASNLMPSLPLSPLPLSLSFTCSVSSRVRVCLCVLFVQKKITHEEDSRYTTAKNEEEEEQKKKANRRRHQQQHRQKRQHKTKQMRRECCGEVCAEEIMINTEWPDNGQRPGVLALTLVHESSQ